MNLPEYFVYITIVVCSWIVFSSQHRNYLSNCCTVSVFFWCSSICLCVHIRTHTHTILVGYSDVSPGVGTRHLKSPESPVGLNLRTCLYRYARRRDEILDWLFFIFEHFLPSWKAKKCEHNTENSNQHGSELHRPFIKGTRLLFKVTKAIIIMILHVTSSQFCLCLLIPVIFITHLHTHIYRHTHTSTHVWLAHR